MAQILRPPLLDVRLKSYAPAWCVAASAFQEILYSVGLAFFQSIPTNKAGDDGKPPTMHNTPAARTGVPLHKSGGWGI